MQLNEFSQLMTVCQVPESESSTCRRADLDTIFITTNFDETQDRADTKSGMLEAAGAKAGSGKGVRASGLGKDSRGWAA
jgi:hypothetical protein